MTIDVIKPLETVYKGYRFRSRTEARWAVFFDALGIEWEYEKEGYDLGEAGWYLPDFWLPTFSGGMFAEVKPDVNGDFEKAKMLCIVTGKQVWLCEGVPDYRAYWVIQRGRFWVDPDGNDSDEWAYEDDIDAGEEWRWGIYYIDCIPNFDQASDENRMFWSPGYTDEAMKIPEEYLDGYHSRLLVKAVNAARSARFEHGEKPKVK